MRVLVVAPDFPYPETHGGRVDIASSLDAWQALGAEVTLVSTVRHAPARAFVEEALKRCRSVTIVHRRFSLRQFMNGLPFQVASRIVLTRVPLKGAFDYVFLHAEHVVPILDNPQLRAGKVLLRVHNDEPNYFAELAQSARAPRRWYYQMEARRLRRAVEQLHRIVDVRYFISKDELRGTTGSAAPAYWLPAGIDWRGLREPNASRGPVLFLGSLFMPNNRAGLQWYLERVHPMLCDDPTYELVIAGNTGGRRIPLNEWSALRRVNVVADPRQDAVNELYERAAVFVGPIVYGGGVKIKILNALIGGLAVVTTELGIEGTGLRDGEHVHVAGDAEEFARHVALLLRDGRARVSLVKSAQRYLRHEYNQSEVLQATLGLATAPTARTPG